MEEARYEVSVIRWRQYCEPLSLCELSTAYKVTLAVRHRPQSFALMRT